MKIYYSSQYINEKNIQLENIVKMYGSRNIILYFDTNLCIYLRDLYREPQSIVLKDDNTWEEIKKILYNIDLYNLDVDFSIGIEEACRNKEGFAINVYKANEMFTCIESLFSMDYLKILSHSKLIKYEPAFKDKTNRPPTKIQGLGQESIFQLLLFHSYAVLLKLCILDKYETSISRAEKMIRFLDFLELEVDVIDASSVVFAYHFLTENSKFKKLIHKTRNIEEFKIDSIWNAAIDLTLPAIVSHKLIKNNKIPVFATSDKLLWNVFEKLKIRTLFTDGDSSIIPPFVEMDFSEANWSESDYRIISNYENEIHKRRKYKYVGKKLDYETHTEKMRLICYKLETEFKNHLVNS